MTNSIVVTKKKRTLIFINIIISCIAASLLTTALTTALPNMIQDFNISVTSGQWLTSGYSLAMGIITPLTAFLINRFPTRRLYLTGILCVIIGLALCVAAPNFLVLMTGRISQACGNGILTSMAQVIILTIYPEEKRGSAMGWYGLSLGAAPVIAPTLAGILVDLYGWRMIFYAVIAIMTIALVFAFFTFDNVLNTVKMKFDVQSFMISAFAFGGLTLGIGNLGSYPLVSVRVLPVIVMGAIAATAFVYRQLHLKEPFLELRVLKDKKFTQSIVTSMLLYFVMMGATVIFPLCIQSIMGYSATISGLVVLPGSLLMAVLSPVTGKIYDKIGMKLLLLVGAFCMLCSTLGVAFIVNIQSPIWLLSFLYFVFNIAVGCILMPIVTWGTSSISANSTAHATALLTTLRTIAGAIGSAVFVTIMTVVARHSVKLYGSNADMYGFNTAFGVMALAGVILLLFAIFGVKQNEKSRLENTNTHD